MTHSGLLLFHFIWYGAISCMLQRGLLDKYGVELIGAKLPSIDRAEDRELFKQSMKRIGLGVPKSGTANNMEEAMAIAADIGRYPLIIRPAFTCGGTGGGIAYNVDEFRQIVQEGLDASMTNQVLVEISLIGWKEFELEVMRDLADNVVIICSIENVDPMGVHTGECRGQRWVKAEGVCLLVCTATYPSPA
jgi:carbamoyl-phosphate synthase large subunit